MMKHHEPQSSFVRYAFGYSDKKPGPIFWIILAGMIAYIVWEVAG